MKNLFLIFLIISTAAFSCKDKTLSSNSNQDENIVQGTTADFKTATENANVQLIDVRTHREYAGGHLKNAKNIDFKNKNFLQQIKKLDKNKSVYLYCRSGRRSGLAAIQLAQEGFSKIYNLDGGILQWNKENLPIKK